MEMWSGAVSLLFQGGVGIPEAANHFSVSLPRCNPMPPGKGSYLPEQICLRLLLFLLGPLSVEESLGEI